jgi:hypothetical protein
VIQSGVALRVVAAAEEATGEVVAVDARIGWLLDLARGRLGACARRSRLG